MPSRKVVIREKFEMTMKEVVAILMESPFYFSLSLRMRLEEIKMVRKLMNND